MCLLYGINKVDGRNPIPVDRWLIPLSIGFQPSKVMQDFFHPQFDILYIILHSQMLHVWKIHLHLKFTLNITQLCR